MDSDKKRQYEELINSLIKGEDITEKIDKMIDDRESELIVASKETAKEQE
jgi:hypothetical protein